MFISSVAIALALLNSFGEAAFPVSPCGSPPPISGGFACGYSRSGSTYKYTYTCGNDCSSSIGDLICPSGATTWAGAVPQCQTASGAPSPCPIDIPSGPPYSKTFGTSKCNDYPGSSSVLCMKDKAGVKILQTSISEVLNAHNCWRKNVDPPAATPIPDLKWDDELAALAERWAVQCPNPNSAHTPNNLNFVSKKSPHGSLYGIGQNMASRPDGDSWAQAIDAWASERNDWTYGMGYSEETGHYTQVIWADSQYVGCARVQCRGVSNVYYFCNYAAAGNVNGQEPYEKAERKRSTSRRKRIYA